MAKSLEPFSEEETARKPSGLVSGESSEELMSWSS